ncbi:Gfo/Idh/MocA family protein [Kibdelosporangium phytohabitans]|uniref:Oxidoreductase n=1 Tax=Kibdelosporangium phytohabitans TaxID=860235 RepID=A0A0N7F3U9_9PSEU|nr:Gfo/Idh/MocA family oxidoreductase [Kibdelosporangium phytohabitans]ALG09639.1 oxidoreductase [Kibdelosporangium phytohabitans]MBE1469018.1 putative dehydrogenase [Kibdelosporangium phytohabitans]
MSVGVGVIGAGVISETYLTNLSSFPDVHVVRVADLDTARAQAQAGKHGVPRAGTVADLFTDPDVELVVNLTIPAAHVEVGLAALDAGKHVWSEKPVALDRQSGRKLLDRAAEKGLRIACAPDTLLGAGPQTGRRAIDEGRIGEPRSALALFQTPGPESWHPAPEFLFQAGGGPLLDMGPYYLTALVSLLGPISKVTGAGGQARPTRVIGSGPRAGTEFAVTVPTTVTALVEFERGGSAQIVLSFDSALRRVGLLEVTGTGGVAVLPDPNHFEGSTTLHLVGQDDAQEIEAQGHAASRGTGALELARAIRTGAPERASGELAYHVLDAMLAIDESITAGRTVLVESTTGIPPALPPDWDPYERTL